MSVTKLSERDDFVAVQRVEVTAPTRIPSAYAWMKAGMFAVYRGATLSGGMERPVIWGWEVDYVNGKTEDGRPSALSYTLFMGKGGYHIQGWLTQPTVFARFFNVTATGPEEGIETPAGRFRCFRAQRPNYLSAWYDHESWFLVKAEAGALRFLLTEVSDTGARPPARRIIVAEPDARSPAALQPPPARPRPATALPPRRKRFSRGVLLAIPVVLVLSFFLVSRRTSYPGGGSSARSFPAQELSRSPGGVWQSMVSQDGLGRIQSIAVDPRHSGVVYAASSGALGGLLRITTDRHNGVTEELVSIARQYTVMIPPGDGFGSHETGDVLAVAFDPVDKDVLYVGFGGIFASSDGGASWRQIYDRPPVHAIAVDPVDSNVIYGGSLSGVRVVKSVDGGATWRILPESPPYVYEFAVDPSAHTTVYAATFAGLHKSTDGGGTWHEVLADRAVTRIALGPGTNGRVLYATAQSPPDRAGGVFTSVDGGATWNNISPRTGSGDFWALAVDPRDPRVVYVGEVGGEGVLKTSDGGGTWTVLSEGLTDKEVFVLAVDARHPLVLWAGTDGGHLFRIVQSQ